MKKAFPGETQQKERVLQISISKKMEFGISKTK